MKLRLPHWASLNLPLENEAQRWNFVNSTIEGCLAVAAIQAVASFVTVYALALGASNPQVGLLVSLPFLANSIVILLGGRFVTNGPGILRPTYTLSAMHRVFVVLMVLAPLLPSRNQVWWVIATYSLASAAAAVTSTWWSTMMSDLFPRQHRGTVFGTRSVFTGSAGVLATLLTGKALDLLPFPLNFTIMFLFAAAVGFVGVLFLARTRLPAIHLDDALVASSVNGVGAPVARPRWREALKGASGRAFMHLAIPVFLFNLGTNLAAPVINIYWVDHLHLSNSRIGFLTAVFLVCQVLSSRFWGRMGDRFGNHLVASATMMVLLVQVAVFTLIPSVPFLFLVQCVGGFAFGGYVMSTFNATIVLGTAKQRAQLISLYNVVAGLGGFLSPPVGTAILDHYGLSLAFLTAAVLRGAGALLMGVSARMELQQAQPTGRNVWCRLKMVLTGTAKHRQATARQGRQ